MKKLLAPLSLALGFTGVALAGLVVSAHASDVADPTGGGWLDLAKPIFNQIMSGHYVAAAALALVLAVALVKRYAPGKAGMFVHSDLGGSVTTLLMSMAGAVATATMAGATWHWGMLGTAALVGLTAMGGYTAIKRLFIVPILMPLAAKAPAWMQPLFSLVLWIFDRRFQADPAKEAEAAGDAAVAANPSGGASDVVGKATDL